MLRRLPVLNTLRAFEAAARLGSFTRASEELCVTLGVKLFNREHQRLVITQAGREYLVDVRDALDRIGLATERLVQRQSSGALTISTSPDFAAKWLVHRLGKFAESYPEIDLRLSAAMHHVDFAREDVDVAVRHGKGDWDGLHVERLCAEQLFPVCTPRLTEGDGLSEPSDILKFPLLHLDTRKDWSTWLDSAGVIGADASRGPIMNRASMVIDAAIDGQGIALARTVLAAWDLIHGRLVRPFAASLPLSKTYWVVSPKATATLPKIKIFRDWLLAEAADDLRQVKELATRSEIAG
jgi:LysR family transcriptional regulator, glycine cleavage system transcriptional activator